MLRVVVSTFPNAKALPLWAGVERNLFAEHGLDFVLHETGSSKEQRTGLAAGEINIVQAAVDNALAMIKAGHDVIIFMGGEGGMNDFIVSPSIRSFSDLAGRTLAVDSPDTAYALLARKVLAEHGLQFGRDYQLRPVGNGAKRLRALQEDRTLAGAILNPPFSAEALLAGMVSLGSLDDLVGPYQAGGAFALRAWAEDNAATVERYIAGYLQALQWLGDDANRNAGVDLLRQRLGLTMAVAQATYEQLRDPNKGFTPRAKFNHAGFATVLDVRAETEGADAAIANPAAYVDLSFYDRVAGASDRHTVKTMRGAGL
ncbi:MAG TPA: ABC transporter substrate-binding protein [Xanthobacteraceae bacterium]|nr:ABC transporter substrate-binding protein [Xanthobacteraceae bacterium]